MKLHLPYRLRAALLACMTIVAPLGTTFATSSLSGAALLSAIVIGHQASAQGFNWNDPAVEDILDHARTFDTDRDTAYYVSINGDIAVMGLVGVTFALDEDGIISTTRYTSTDGDGKNTYSVRLVNCDDGHALVCGGLAFIEGSGLNITTNDLSVQGDSWLNVTTYGTGTSTWDTLVGGNYSYTGPYTADKILTFTGDSHIMLRPADEEQTVSTRNIIGGNFRSAVLGHFVGSSYIYVAPGASVYGSIIGGSTSDFGVADTALAFTQSSNIWIYTPLSTQAAAAGDLVLNVGDASVIGGNAVTNGTAMMGMGGNTNIYIDLSATGGEAVFSKRVIGGSYAVGGGVGHEGSVNVSISAPNTVTFSQKIIGGSYISGGAALHEGNINVSINGGKFVEDVVLGGYMASAGLSITNNGASTLTVRGGSFSPDKKIIGGIYESTAASTVISNGITLNLSGATFGSIIGGHYITGTGNVDLAGFKTGDINITIGNGAIVNGVILGGSSSERKPAASATVWEQGAITITLGTGSIINGGVYAAGGCAGDTTGVTSRFLTDSTRVIIQSGVTLGDSVTISGGYRNTTAAAQIKQGGERVLEMQGTGEIRVANMENANLIDFDKIEISANASFTTPNADFFSRSPIFRKGGAGTLIIADGTTHASSALSVEEGVVSLAGTSALDMTVKSGASFQSSHGATLTGTLTMESGSSMVWTGSDTMLTVDGGSINFADDGVTLDISKVNPALYGYTIDLVEMAGIKDDWGEWSSLRIKAASGYTGLLSVKDDVLRVSQVKSGLYWLNGDAADPNGNNWTVGDADNFVASLDNPDVKIQLKPNDSVYFDASGQPTAVVDGVLAPTVIGDVVVHDLVVNNNTDLHLTVMENNSSSLTVTGAAVATYGSTIGKYGKGTLAVTQNVVDAVENFVLDAGTLVISDILKGEIDLSNIQATNEDTTLSVSFSNDEGNELTLKDTTAADPNNTFKSKLQIAAGKVTTTLAADRHYELNSGSEVTLSGFNPNTVAEVIGDGTLVLKDLENYDGSAQLGLTEDEWTGTVLLKNVSLDGATFADLGNLNSTIAFDAVSGNLGTDVIQAGMHLTGEGLDLSSDPLQGALRVNGPLSGEGSLNLGTNSITFLGGTEDYTGVIRGETKLNDDGTLDATATITFDSEVLNADGTPNTMSVYNGTFDGEVNVVVADGKGLQLDAPTSIGRDLTVGRDSKLKLTGDSTLNVGGVVKLDRIASTLDLSELNIVRSDTRVINVGDTVDALIDQDGTVGNVDLVLPEYFEALGFKLVWDAQNHALALGNNDIAEPTNYYRTYAGGGTNAQAGATMLDNAYNAMGQNIPDGSDLKQLLRAVDTMINRGQSPQDALAAASGASATAMGLAFAGDLQRQMRAIRNRTTTMGISDDVVQDVPYFNAWVNAEGDYRKVDNDGLLPGYEINSWGGTVGMDVDVTPNLTCGLALTAMYGDLEAQSIDAADGDLNTYYLTAFARYAPSAWVHTFVVSFGLVDAELNRTVSYGSGSYHTSGDTNGFGFGLMYEVGYTIPMNDEGTTALQPVVNVTYAHTSIGGYSESGSDMAINFGDQEMDVFTIGVGLRAQTVIGHNTFNRSALLEGRLLAKFDLGDRSCSTSTGLAHYNLPGGTVESAETGAFGLELGVGVTLPVGQNAGSVFIDASLELRSEYTNANATIGYRINF